MAADGHQVALEGLTAITATVTSADGSRTRTYRVAFGEAEQAIALTPTWTSFEWPGTDGIALADALRDGGLADTVIVVYYWDETSTTWLAFFPGLEDVPGLNTLSSLQHGKTYWIAVSEPVTWTVPPLTAVADVEVEATARASAFTGTVTDPGEEVAAGLAVEAYVGDTRCDAGGNPSGVLLDGQAQAHPAEDQDECGRGDGDRSRLRGQVANGDGDPTISFPQCGRCSPSPPIPRRHPRPDASGPFCRP